MAQRKLLEPRTSAKGKLKPREVLKKREPSKKRAPLQEKPYAERKFRVRSDKYQWIIEELKGSDPKNPSNWKPVSYHARTENVLLALEDLIAKDAKRDFLEMEGSLEELHEAICNHMERFYRRRLETLWGPGPRGGEREPA